MATKNDDRQEERGKELHREFVGMLFALAIAEVAVQASTVVNAGIVFSDALPAYSHLVLAATVIATSWVGWGWSKSGLSRIKTVFSRDFGELLLDVWLVAVYFFIAKGVELSQDNASGKLQIVPSLRNESLWVMTMFITYFVWDLWTKPIWDRSGRLVLCQRGWASLSCAVLAVVAFVYLPRATKVDTWSAVTGDSSLLLLVFLFRAMKLKNLRDITLRHWCGIAVLMFMFAAALEMAAKRTEVVPWLYRILS